MTEPTPYPPGSSAKLEVMRQRAELEQPLFVAGDNGIAGTSSDVGREAT